MKPYLLTRKLKTLVLPTLTIAGLTAGPLSAENVSVTINGKTVEVDKDLFDKAQKAAAAAKKEAPKGNAETASHEIPEFSGLKAGHRLNLLEELKVVEGGLSQVTRRKIGSEPQEKDGTAIQEAFRLRSSWDPVKLFHFDPNTDKWVESETTGLASDGADFGWTRNRLTQTDKLTAKGVAYFPIVFNASGLHQFLLLPSVEFNRDSSTDGTKNRVDSLVARLGVDFNFIDSRVEGDASGYVVRAAAGYQTDFDFASGQWVFDLQTEPVSQKQGVGVFANKPGQGDGVEDQVLYIPGLRRKVTIAPIFSVADISDVGNKESLKKLANDFATIGFKAGLDWELTFLDGFTTLAGTKIGAEYRWWSTVGAKSAQYDYLDAHIVVPFLGSSDKLMLKAFYRHGDTPVTLERVDTVGLSLNAKF